MISLIARRRITGVYLLHLICYQFIPHCNIAAACVVLFVIKKQQLVIARWSDFLFAEEFLLCRAKCIILTLQRYVEADAL